jgi:arabinofuranosyltransferase
MPSSPAFEILARYFSEVVASIGLVIALLCTVFVAMLPRSRAHAARLPGITRWIVLAVIVAGALAWAWHLRWLCDDAFISFRYGENLVRGHGLVFNPGERVEGYTNFLWTVLMAGAIALRLQPEQVSIILSLAAFVGNLVLAARLVRRHAPPGQRVLVPLAALALGGSYLFASYATSGLETMASAFLVTLALERADAQAPLAAGAAAIAATLAHPDQAISYVALGAVLLLQADRRRSLAFYSAPLLLVYVPYYLWRWHYYGDFFPNTYYAKSANLSYFQQGAIWLGVSLTSAGLWAVAPLILFALVHRRREFVPRFVTLAVCLHFAYEARIGGDFMVGRLLCPLLPALLVVAELGIRDLLAEGRWRLGLVATAIGIPLLLPTPILRPQEERWFVTDERTFYPLTSFAPIRVESDLFGYGQTLLRRFKARGLEPVIAVFRVGMIGYYGRLPMIDRFGLTERTIAHQPLTQRARPGHEKKGSNEYVLAHGAELTGWLPFYPDPWGNALTRLVVDGTVFHLAHWDPVLLDRLRGQPGVAFLEFPAYLDHYLATAAGRPAPALTADLRFFEAFYFSKVADPRRHAALTAVLKQAQARKERGGAPQ